MRDYRVVHLTRPPLELLHVYVLQGANGSAARAAQAQAADTGFAEMLVAVRDMRSTSQAAEHDPRGLNLELTNLTAGAAPWGAALGFLLGPEVASEVMRSVGEAVAVALAAANSSSAAARHRAKALRFLQAHPSKCRHATKLGFLEPGDECATPAGLKDAAGQRRRRRLRRRS